ncbi:hypothetical protein MHUMG1_10463 [Metarhizium humberi]|uniref:Uncharacterized protein n=1 Tax=Metarhizium humberi TaxID=2596975 RepID=A0A9P8S2I0_9HYPO|nr:hypothetical protein MHUMG1_10463 [Metarhizium humberi]
MPDDLKVSEPLGMHARPDMHQHKQLQMSKSIIPASIVHPRDPGKAHPTSDTLSTFHVPRAPPTHLAICMRIDFASGFDWLAQMRHHATPGNVTVAMFGL